MTKEVPTTSLFYAPVVISVVVSGIIQLLFQLWFFIDIRDREWYIPPYNAGGETFTSQNIVSYEDTVILMVSNFQYVTTCLAFSKGKPWRRPMYTNLLFTISAIILLLIDTIIVVYPLNTDGFLYWKFLSLLPLPSWYRLRLIAPAVVLNSVTTFCVEYFIITECVTKRADLKQLN